MNQPEITVIVPIYNTEKYLSNCIESILKQSFTDFELLLINDGSTDKSGEICDEYAKKDCRIKVVHKKNSGVSSTRNYGIELAKGELICFIDSDDWIEQEFLNTLYIKSNSADLIILTNVAYDYYTHTVYRGPNYSKNIYFKEEITQFLIENDFFSIGEGGCYSKLFKKNLIKKNNVKFLENNAAYEDTLFTFDYLCKCESVSIASGCHYHYMHRNSESLSKRIHPYHNYLDSGNKGLELLSEMKQKYNVDKNSSFFVLGTSKFLGILNYSIFSLYSDFKQTKKEERIALLRSLSETNKLYQDTYKPYNFKQLLVYTIIRLPSKIISDIFLILIFKISKIIKSK